MHSQYAVSDSEVVTCTATHTALQMPISLLALTSSSWRVIGTTIGGLPWLVELRRWLGTTKSQLDPLTRVANDGSSCLVLHAKKRTSIYLRRYTGDTHMVWCGVLWCGVVWCSSVWCGVEWCGVVWCSLVWCGVEWCGVV